MTNARYAHPHYHGTMPYHAHHGGPVHPGRRHGFCHGCCHPVAECQCTRRDCRKEAKELLAEPGTGTGTGTGLQIGQEQLELLKSVRSATPKDMQLDPGVFQDDAGLTTALFSTASAGQLEKMEPARMGRATAFIGGGCCVHLSIEYTPMAASTGKDPATSPAVVAATVVGSDGTTLIWGKRISAGEGYQIKEDILVTKPGARVTLAVVDATARLRWCEIFSC